MKIINGLELEDILEGFNMNDEEGFIYKEALDKWGVQSQLQMAIEECAEFIVKAAKLYRNKNNSTPLEVIEEIADVKIMME